MHFKFWRAARARCALSGVTLLLSGLPLFAETVNQPPQPPDFSCDQIVERPRASGASVAKTAGESLQHKNWQPIGGLIEFTVTSATQIDADATITTCFRWKVESGPSAKFGEDHRPVRWDLSTDRKTLKVTVAVPELLPTEKKAHAIWVVPLAEVRIVALKANAPLVDVWTEIGITYPLFSLFLALAVVILAFVALNIVVQNRVTHAGIREANWLLRIISTPSATASLSQLQILLWTFAIAASAIYVVTLSGQLVEITTGTLILLGISGAATLASQAHSENQTATKQADADKAAKDALKAQADAGANPPPAAQAVVDAAIAKAAEARAKASAVTSPPAGRKPQWSDLIVNENQDGVREIDVARVQMLLFTLISASFVIVKVIAAYVIPEIPVGYLTLMGISNGVYVGSKVVRQT
jgi:hypothetical protein